MMVCVFVTITTKFEKFRDTLINRRNAYFDDKNKTNNDRIMCVLCAIVNALEKAKKKIPPLSFSNAKEEEKTNVEERLNGNTSSSLSFVDEIINEKKKKRVDTNKNVSKESLEEELKELRNWSFDAFTYASSKDKEFPLARLFMAAFDVFANGGVGERKREDVKEIFALINREKLFEFAQSIEHGYVGVDALPYHNVAHGCEVVHATFAILTDVITEETVMDPLSVFSLLVAAIGHDCYHPGCDNATLAKDRVDIKRRYNGQSLSEMVSCEVTLELLRRSGALQSDDGLTTSQIAFVEDVVATSILSTDLSKHEENLKKNTAENAAQIVLKSADLAHFARPREVHLKWVHAAMDEQRRNTKRQVGVKDGHVDWKNQVFFAETFVLPTFATLSGNVSVGSTPMYEYAKTNVEKSRELIV